MLAVRTTREAGRAALRVRVFARWAAALVAALALCAPPCAGQVVGPGADSREEAVPEVDPYTRGERASLGKAGYVSLGPPRFGGGMRGEDVRESLGGIPVQWVETAHFRIGSTLATYRFQGDAREERRIAAELERLAKKLPRVRGAAGKLDPWLRLHLYAQRCEEQYADFQRRFGFDDADFAPREGAPAHGEPGYMGEGPYLGEEEKFAVLLFEKSSGLGRFAQRFLRAEPGATSYRGWLPAGGLALATGAQGWRELGYELDAVIHGVVANDLALNFVDGLRKSRGAAPEWFRVGLGHWYSRRAEERWTPYAKGTAKDHGDDSWKWEPRVRNLVANKAGASWRECFAWTDAAAIPAHEHMLAWSRIDWILSAKDSDLRALAVGLTDSLYALPEADRARARLERQERALSEALGGTPEELDQTWRKHVLQRYARD